jgi:hypothetical protein
MVSQTDEDGRVKHNIYIRGKRTSKSNKIETHFVPFILLFPKINPQITKIHKVKEIDRNILKKVF